MGEARRNWKIKTRQVDLKRGQAKACPTSEWRNSELRNEAVLVVVDIEHCAGFIQAQLGIPRVGDHLSGYQRRGDNSEIRIQVSPAATESSDQN